MIGRAGRVVFGLALCALVAAASPVGPGPYGVKFGQPLASLKQLGAFGSGNSFLVEVPDPHALLDTYAAKADRAGGVCMIDGMAFLAGNDGGARAVTTFTGLRDELNAAYGPGSLGDNPRPLPEAGSDFWGPKSKSSLYSMIWSAKTNANFPPEWRVRLVMLLVTAGETPIIHLFYFSESGCGRD